MEPYIAISTSAGIFGAAALGGMGMAVVRLGEAPRPLSAIALLHGMLAAAGLSLLLYMTCTAGIPPTAQIAAGLMVVVALAGGWMTLRLPARRRALPVMPVMVHATVALLGLALMVALLVQSRGAG